MNNRFNFCDYGNPEYPFSGSMLRGSLFVGGGSKSSASTQSSSSTQNVVNDSRAVASEGSVLAGANSSISISSTDGGLVAQNNAAIIALAESSAETSSRGLSDAVYGMQRASEASSAASSDAAYSASEAAKAAIGGNSQVARDANYSMEKVSSGAVAGITKVAADGNYSMEKVASASAAASAKTAQDAIYSGERNVAASLAAGNQAQRDALDFSAKMGSAAISGMGDIAYEGLKTARAGMDFTAGVNRDVLDFGAENVQDSLDFVGKAQKEQNDLIRYTNEQFTNKLAQNAGDAPQTTVDNIIKYVTIAGTILGIVVLFRSKSKAA